MPMKKSTDTIGNRTRDLPACSAVPQPTAPPRPRYGKMESRFEFSMQELRFVTHSTLCRRKKKLISLACVIFAINLVAETLSALSKWKNQLLGQSSGRFLRTAYPNRVSTAT
jgi:hypothetical protein